MQTWDIDTINKNVTNPADDITKITDGFDALRTLFSGTAAPSDTVAYMFWADTTNALLKQRNAANSAWQIRGSLDTDLVITKTSAYTVVAGDYGKTILGDATSAAFTFTLTAAATLGEGWWCIFKKSDSTANAITIDGNSTETIDLSLTKTLNNRYDTLIVVSDGTNLYISSLYSILPGSLGADIASASTIELGNATGSRVIITGTTTITALSSIAPRNGTTVKVKFAGALILTHNATSLILPTGANITTAANDEAEFTHLGSNNWKCSGFLRADGTALAATSSSVSVAVRQTILSAAVDSNGISNFLAIGTGLAVNLSATTVPITVAFAAGYDSNGAVNYIGRATADLTSAWSSLTASSTLYLYVEYNAGAFTYGFTSLAPNYGWGITKSTTSGQHTFRIDEMKMYVGNGSSATAVNRVFLGECVTSGVAVTSVTAYQVACAAFLTQATIAAGTQYTFAHNLGFKDLIVSACLECLTAEQGFSIGDRVNIYTEGNSGTSTAIYGAIATHTYKSLFLTTGTTAVGVISRNAGAAAGWTAANWKLIANVRRSW
jgi:hypothetical protein